MNEHELLAMRHDKDQFFKLHPQSPLTPEQQEKFTGLNYYDPNPDLDLIVDVQPLDNKEYVTVDTTTGELRRYERYGRFSFTIDGKKAELTIYQSPHGYFLPFVDANVGTETYPAGRYLEPEQIDVNTFRVDFNLAYNPYCAYGDGWSCPITPVENHIDVAIRAGEKNPTLG